MFGQERDLPDDQDPAQRHDGDGPVRERDEGRPAPRDRRGDGQEGARRAVATRCSEMPKNWNRRFKHNRDKIKTGDIYELAEVVRNLAVREHQKGLSTGEKQMFTRAKKILASELMYALEMDEDGGRGAPRRPARRVGGSEGLMTGRPLRAGSARGRRRGVSPAAGRPRALGARTWRPCAGRGADDGRRAARGRRPRRATRVRRAEGARRARRAADAASGACSRCAPSPAIDRIVVALPEGVALPVATRCRTARSPAPASTRRRRRRHGGEQRSHSVRSALAAGRRTPTSCSCTTRRARC